MNIRSKTYRFFSALTLILFMSSIVLPSGISAAGLFCDMEMDMNMAAMQADADACCDINNTNILGHHQSEAAKEHCQDEQVCPHLISDNQTEVQATVTHQLKDVVAVAVIEVKQSSSDDRLKGHTFESFLTVLPSSPSLFLLNSSFLN